MEAWLEGAQASPPAPGAARQARPLPLWLWASEEGSRYAVSPLPTACLSLRQRQLTRLTVELKFPGGCETRSPCSVNLNDRSRLSLLLLLSTSPTHALCKLLPWWEKSQSGSEGSGPSPPLLPWPSGRGRAPLWISSRHLYSGQVWAGRRLPALPVRQVTEALRARIPSSAKWGRWLSPAGGLRLCVSDPCAMPASEGTR